MHADVISVESDIENMWWRYQLKSSSTLAIIAIVQKTMISLIRIMLLCQPVVLHDPSTNLECSKQSCKILEAIK